MKLMIMSSHPEIEYGPFKGFIYEFSSVVPGKWRALDFVTIIAGHEDDRHCHLALELRGESGGKRYDAHIMARASSGEGEGVFLGANYEIIEELICNSDELDHSIFSWIDRFDNLLATRDVNRLRPYQN